MPVIGRLRCLPSIETAIRRVELEDPRLGGVTGGISGTEGGTEPMKSITRPGFALWSASAPSENRSMAEELARIEPRRETTQGRVHPRVEVNGKVRLVADTPDGLVTLSGDLVDLSVSGCAIRVYAPLEPRGEARLELTVDGRQVWVSGHVVWTRIRQRAWIAGVRFDRLVPEKQSLLIRVVAERQRYVS